MSTAAVKGTVSDGVVDFLFKMLGDGFEFDKNKIHDVFGKFLHLLEELSVYEIVIASRLVAVADMMYRRSQKCKVDIQSVQTMEELLDESASTLKKYDDVHDLAGENVRKVLEADQKSSQKLFRIKESDDDEMPLDLHEHEPKQALPLLKFHLTTLAFLQSKTIDSWLGQGDEDMKGARKKLASHTLEISLTNLCHYVGIDMLIYM
ncbi:hypothetical protein JHK87_034622 [Glycine soja]|nr:hypothetical protein JHK87_034622 [Glycine soja]